jgi:hypothetical protein
LFAFHVSRFVENAVAEKRENDERLAALRSAQPGTVFVMKPYAQIQRSRWRLGDDFVLYPWLAEYVTGELYDLANVDVPGAPGRAWGRLHLERIYDPTLPRHAEPATPPLPTYRQWLGNPAAHFVVGSLLAPVGDHALRSLRIELLGLPFDDPVRRPVNVVAWTSSGFRYVEGVPHDDSNRHVIRVRAATIPPAVDSTYVLGCQQTKRVEPVRDGDTVLLAVDERDCRGPFTAVMCEPHVCWIAGWY